ncbi:MAG: hypothetical protein K8S98_15745 [Planctomycetes bacterium]|nr:hypothetical protein [Planctomycetota bacterium]
MLPELDRSLRRLLARAKTAAWLEACARLAAPAVFVLGGWVLLARFALGQSRTAAAWSLAAFALVPVAAWFVARRRFLTPEAAVAWLDRRSGGSGALLTHFVLDDERWAGPARDALASIERLPRIAAWRDFRTTALGALFVGAAFVLDRAIVPTPPATQVALNRIDAASADLIALQEVVELAPETAKELEARLERLRDEGDAAPLDASLEAVDRTQEELARNADEALAAAERARDALSSAGAAEDAQATVDGINAALRDLKEAGLAAKLPKSLLERLDPGSLQLPDGVKLSAQELAQLSDELAAALDARMERLAKAGLVGKAQLERFRELERFSDHVCDGECKRAGVCKGAGRANAAPGRGGVSRGRGDAELTWGDEAVGKSDEFTAKALDPATMLDPESTAIVGLAANAPTVDAQGESAGGANVEASGGQGVWRRRLAPHHRDAVQRFFSGPRRE